MPEGSRSECCLVCNYSPCPRDCVRPCSSCKAGDEPCHPTQIESDRRFYLLEHHIRNFVPSGWVEPVVKVAFCPFILKDEFPQIEEAAKQKSLFKFLQEWRGGVYSKPYIEEAIMSFFREGGDEKIVAKT